MSYRFFYLVGGLRRGGLEHQLYYLLKIMDRMRYQPEVVVWDFCEADPFVREIRALGVVLHSFPKKFSRAMKLRAFRRLLMQVRPDVVHSYTFYTNFAALWATRGTKIIPVGAVRSDFDWAKKEAGPWLGRLSGRWPRTQIFNSVAAAKSAQMSRSLFVPRHCLVVRNGLDIKRFAAVPPPVDGKARILGVGSLLPVKRWDRLLAAAAALRRRHFEIVVRIAGDGPLRIPLMHQAFLLGIADCVEFVGSSENISSLIAEANFLAHTSDNEGCPNAVMEAMACGRAVVATDAGDIPYIVEDGKTGFVVRRGDEETLFDRMARLAIDRDLCRSLGEAGRAKAERDFGLARLLSETLSAYRAAGWKDTQSQIGGEPRDGDETAMYLPEPPDPSLHSATNVGR